MVLPGKSSVSCPSLGASAGVLRQLADFIEGIGPDAYRRPCRVLSGSSIGQHVRHSLDHFAAPLGALRGGAIDYDHRDRDTPVEREPDEAVAGIHMLLSLLDGLLPADLERPVRVRVMLNAEGDEADFGSTLGRELAFAAHHAVHHQAMIAAIAMELGLSSPIGFGKAPSTLHHARANVPG